MRQEKDYGSYPLINANAKTVVTPAAFDPIL